jgi:hypothetical protein
VHAVGPRYFLKARRGQSPNRNGVQVVAYPCRPAGVRGLRACIVVIDELAFFLTSDGRPTDTEMLRACRGRLATTSGKLIILSSPYSQSGALYELHRKHYGREESPVLVWQASAPAMNPTLRTDYLARMAQDDPEAYQSEVLGQFRPGVATFLDPDVLAACIDAGVRERPPRPGVPYVGLSMPRPAPAKTRLRSASPTATASRRSRCSM